MAAPKPPMGIDIKNIGGTEAANGDRDEDKYEI
jgi:hypothetical protein